MMKKTVLAFAGAIALVAALSGCTNVASTGTDAHPEEMHVDNAWVRVSEFSDHAGGMTGVFAEIENHTNGDVTLVGGSAEIAGMVEVHEVVMADGAMTMQKKDGGIVIKPGEIVALEPGGLHVMLMGLKQPILEGDEITLTLDFDGAEDMTLTVPAKASFAGDETYVPEEN